MDHNKLIHQLLRYTLLLKSKYDCNITAAAAESKFFNLDLDFFEVFSIIFSLNLILIQISNEYFLDYDFVSQRSNYVIIIEI